MKLKETAFKKEKIYVGKAVDFCSDTVILPDNTKAVREYLYHPGAVAVVPFINKKDIILVRQFRYPVGKATYEIPAGKMDKNESPLKCARRELKEETGYGAKTVKKLLSFWPTPAFSNEILHIYSAFGLFPGDKCPDEDEFVETLSVPYKEALDMVKTGKIKDSKTVIALTYLAAFGTNNHEY